MAHLDPKTLDAVVELATAVEPHIVGSKKVTVRVVALRRLLDAVGAAFDAGWNAHETGYSSRPQGREEAKSVFLKGHDFTLDD